MFWKKNNTKTIIDRSAMRTAPDHHPLHLLYTLLLAIAFAGALWQHGHPSYTLSVLLAILPCSLMVYIPYRWIPSMFRITINCMLFGFICFWSTLRLKEGVMPDKALMESLAATSLIFLMNGRRKDLSYLFFISIFMMIYGSLIPRMFYLYLQIPFFLLLLTLLYWNRASSLAGGRTQGKAPRVFRRNWHYYMLHLLLTLIVFWYVFSTMPLTNNEVPGMFEVSFLTERDSALPPDAQKWMKNENLKHSPKGQQLIQTGKPDTIEHKGTPTQQKDPKNKASAEGNGAGQQGQDLVFYAKTPVKLYHLVQLYDEYDGEKWNASPRMKKTRIHTGNTYSLFYQVNVDYTVMKWASTKLAAPFAPLSYQTTKNKESLIRMSTTFFNAELIGPRYPVLPFYYTVSSAVAFPQPSKQPPPPPKVPEKQLPKPAEIKQPPATKSPAKPGGKPAAAKPKPKPDPFWPEYASKHSYLILPKKKISKRVLNLSAELVKNHEKPYDKAMALRDYLRNHFRYQLNAVPTPPGEESTDYFLFTLKEGHCEYFAAALTVLARAAGLPARVATGYSPGNYNTMTNLFEVHEYHAHAWTQIYIDEIGWLTFDATPPQSVRSETRPIGFGALRDPFGDEWKITPPEITEHTLQFIKNDIIKEAKKNEDVGTLEKALIKTAVAQEAIQKNIKKTYQATVRQLDKKNKEGFLRRTMNTLNSLQAGITNLFLTLCRSWIVFLFTACGIASGVFLLRLLWDKIQAVRKRKKMERLIASARDLQEKDPSQALHCIYFALRLTLELAGIHRRKNIELLDYAKSLQVIDPSLSGKVLKIFQRFYRLEYGGTPPEAAEAAELLSLLEEIQSLLSDLRAGKAIPPGL